MISRMEKSPKKWISALLLAALWLAMSVAIFKNLIFRLYDPDLWWHLAAGRTILEYHSLLRTEIFSHPLSGAPWIDFEWLSQVIFFKIYEHWSLTGLYWMRLILSLTAIGFFVIALRAAGIRGFILLALNSVGFLILRPRLLERPELFTLNFLSIILAILLLARTKPRLRRLSLVAIFSVMVAWVNLHGGFLFGTALIALVLVGSWWSEAEVGYRRFLKSALIVSAIAIPMNPYGIKIVTIFSEHLSQFQSGLTGVQEWSSPTIKQLPVFWGLLVLSFGWLSLALLRKDSEARLWAPAIIVFGCWGAASYRSTALLAFVALPFLAASLSKVRSIKWLNLVSVVVVVVIFRAQIIYLPRFMTPHDPIRWYHFPVGAVDFLKKEKVSGKMFNSYEFGGYLEWTQGPAEKIFYDGRYLFFPLLKETGALTWDLLNKGINHWPAFFDRYGVDYAVVSLLNPLSSQPEFYDHVFPRTEWALVYWDDAALVFVRRTGKFLSVISGNEFRYIRPYDLEGMARDLAEGKSTKAEIKFELSRSAGPLASWHQSKIVELLLTK